MCGRRFLSSRCRPMLRIKPCGVSRGSRFEDGESPHGLVGAERLLLAVRRHLQLFPRAECRSYRRLDLNDAARLRVATHPCGALACLEIAEAGNLHLRALLQLCGDDALVVEERFNGARGIGLRHLRTHRQRGGEFSLVQDRKSTRLNSSHGYISYAVFCLKKKKNPCNVI